MTPFLRIDVSGVALLGGLLLSPLACSSDSNETPAGTAGTTAAAGSAGSAGTQGNAGMSGGGSGGATGGAGAGGATAGMAGAAGMGGATAGTAGMGGAAGANAGAAGASGGAGGAAGGGGAGGGAGAAPFELSSPAFAHVEACSEEDHAPCEEFPVANLLDTIGGDNMSPELSWGPGPQGTLSYALVLHDYTNGFTHWALWNISADTLMLPANMMMPPDGASQVSFVDGEGYAGPGAFDHVYEFRLYALSEAMFTPGNAGDQGAVRGELEDDQDGIVLGFTDLRGVTPQN